MRILLLDPDYSSRMATAAWLTEFFGGIAIRPVSSPAEALQAIGTHSLDLMVAAHPMPALGGIALTAMIKSRPHPPVIVLLTAGPATGLDLQCRAAGVDLLLEKRHLRSRLLGFLQRRFPKVWADGAVARSQRSLR
jgi:phosphoserine phosphatase RsbU/P